MSTGLFGTRVIAAPMAGGTSTTRFVEAVHHSGGLGFLAAGYKPVGAMRDEVQAAKAAGDGRPDSKLPAVDIIELPRPASRPSGARFGALVHAVLASVALDAELKAIGSLAAIHGRILSAAQEEIDAATESVSAALAHPLFDRARHAAKQGRCRREVPIAWRDPDGFLTEGVIDLAFAESGGFTHR